MSDLSEAYKTIRRAITSDPHLRHEHQGEISDLVLQYISDFDGIGEDNGYGRRKRNDLAREIMDGIFV